MALATFKVDTSITWTEGAGGAPKYTIEYKFTCDMTVQTITQATFHLYGNINVINHQAPDRNSHASDYAIISTGDMRPADYPFTPGQDYAFQPLPFVPGAPAAALDKVLIEFRGDLIEHQQNAVSLYTKNQGYILQSNQEVKSWTYPFDTTYTMPLTGDENQTVLWYTETGVGSSGYGWTPRPFATLIDFSYRPGYSIGNGVELSHNREGGAANILGNGSWNTMRTMSGGIYSDDPPFIKHPTGYKNMRRIGQE